MNKNPISRTSIAALASLALLSCLTMAPVGAAHDDDAALLKALLASKLSLVDGIEQVSKNGEAAISAKFEMDDGGKLSLSVYTAQKGLAVDAENNVLKEYGGSPETAPWAPGAEVFKDIPHVARASSQLALMSLSRRSLAQLVTTAQKGAKGTVLSATPGLVRGRAVLAVSVVHAGHVTTSHVDLVSGRAVK